VESSEEEWEKRPQEMRRMRARPTVLQQLTKAARRQRSAMEGRKTSRLRSGP